MTLPPYLSITQVDDGPHFVAPLFRQKFAGDAPTPGNHLVMFYRAPSGEHRVVCYGNFMPFGDIMLVGGVCTDGGVIRMMSEEERLSLTELGGAYHLLLTYGFRRFAADCEAFFGYCGDARAETVNLSSGFVKTGHQYLLVNFHKSLHPVMQRALIAKAHAIGPF